METLTFTTDRIEYFRAKVEAIRPESFDDVVKFFQRECGMSKGHAIIAARKTRGDLYNAFHAALHRGATRNMGGSHGPVQVLSMRSRTGAPLFNLRGL